LILQNPPQKIPAQEFGLSHAGVAFHHTPVDLPGLRIIAFMKTSTCTGHTRAMQNKRRREGAESRNPAPPDCTLNRVAGIF
jgi:hypothetical protein